MQISNHSFVSNTSEQFGNPFVTWLYANKWLILVHDIPGLYAAYDFFKYKNTHQIFFPFTHTYIYIHTNYKWTHVLTNTNHIFSKNLILVQENMKYKLKHCIKNMVNTNKTLIKYINWLLYSNKLHRSTVSLWYIIGTNNDFIKRSKKNKWATK